MTINQHPSEEVNQALTRLLDALCTWERNTGHHHLLILKDSCGFQSRVLDQVPVGVQHSDGRALVMYFDLLDTGKDYGVHPL
jgi:hypothetical protein